MPCLGRRVKGYKRYWNGWGKVSLPFSLGRRLRAVFQLSCSPSQPLACFFLLAESDPLHPPFPCLKKPPAFALPAAASLAPSMPFIPSGLLCSLWGGLPPIAAAVISRRSSGPPQPPSLGLPTLPLCLPRTPADGPLRPFPSTPFLTLLSNRLPRLLPRLLPLRKNPIIQACSWAHADFTLDLPVHLFLSEHSLKSCHSYLILASSGDQIAFSV